MEGIPQNNSQEEKKDFPNQFVEGDTPLAQNLEQELTDMRKKLNTPGAKNFEGDELKRYKELLRMEAEAKQKRNSAE